MCVSRAVAVYPYVLWTVCRRRLCVFIRLSPPPPPPILPGGLGCHTGGPLLRSCVWWPFWGGGGLSPPGGLSIPAPSGWAAPVWYPGRPSNGETPQTGFRAETQAEPPRPQGASFRPPVSENWPLRIAFAALPPPPASSGGAPRVPAASPATDSKVSRTLRSQAIAHSFSFDT